MSPHELFFRTLLSVTRTAAWALTYGRFPLRKAAMNAPLQHCVRVVCLIVAASSTASAQLVSVRTAPVVVAEQFFMFPSRLLGMGGGLAMNDIALDPFSNPATGARIEGGIVSSTPTLYSLPTNNGFGRTLPIALMYGNGNTFA